LIQDMKDSSRKTLNGLWLIDSSISPSLRGYLEAMAISEEIIQIHEKKENEKDVTFDITLNETEYTIKNFYWQDFGVPNANVKILRIKLGEEQVESINGARSVTKQTRRTLAESNDLKHVCVIRSMVTTNGIANITDVKTLVERNSSIAGSNGNDENIAHHLYPMMRQELTIANESLCRKHTLVRFFLPIDI